MATPQTTAETNTKLEAMMAEPIGEEETTPQADQVADQGAERPAESQGEETPESGPLPTEEGQGEEPESTSEAQPAKRVAGYEQLLPMEQADEYPDELFQVAARKYGWDPSDLADEKIGPKLLSTLKSKIDSDIVIKAQKYRDDLLARETPEEEAEPEGETEQPTEARTPATLSTILESAMKHAEPFITDEGAKLYSDSTVQAFQELQEAQDSGDDKAIAKAQRNLAKGQYAFAMIAASEVLTNMSDIVNRHVDERVDGKLMSRDQVMRTYKEAKELLAQDPEYSDVKELTKAGEFEKILKEYPDISTRQHNDESGKPLPPLQNALAQYKHAYRLIRGGKPQPKPTEAVKTALATGRRQATESQQRQQLGNVGPGRPSGGFQGQKESAKDYIGRLKKASEEDDPFANYAFAKS